LIELYKFKKIFSFSDNIEKKYLMGGGGAS